MIYDLINYEIIIVFILMIVKYRYYVLYIYFFKVKRNGFICFGF